ncbi:MAG: nucleoside-diphosphate sugar epimerase/dehydratase [bacterium]
MSSKTLYKLTIILLDVVAIFLIYLLSSTITKNITPTELAPWFYLTICSFTAIKVFGNYIVGNYEILWMYRIRKNFVKMIQTCIVLNIIVSIIFMLLYYSDLTVMSYNIIVVSMLTEFSYIFISRFVITYFMDNYFDKDEKINIPTKRTLIIGAGSAGNMMLNEIANDKFGYNVVGFVDDNVNKINTTINAVKIYGPINNINKIIKNLDVKEVILAMPTASPERIQEIIDLIDLKSVNLHITPDKNQILEGSISKTMRKVSISDLLGRESIELNKTKLKAFINNQTVLVTGGGGSIGSEICRQILEYNPKRLIIFDIYENSMYQLKTELDIFYRDKDEKPQYIALVGSVRDEKRLQTIFEDYSPNIVFHAAAHKHVPLMEDSPLEAIKNNIGGTYNVAKMCNQFRIDKMVLISTDKAVNPTNVMGTSKRFCEMVVEAWNEESAFTKYSMVRFGNVLGSNGSVIPLFEKQIAAGGPLTITHAEINRFFMTIPEACGLVIESLIYADGGEKFILDMGKPVKIMDLAKKMIKLSGLTLGTDIEIEITGLRPGEKLYEELLLDYSSAKKTPNKKIFIEKSNNPFNLKQIDEIIYVLNNTTFYENKEILNILDKVEEKKVERK